MATYVIWMDSREAKVFKSEGSKKTLKHAHTHGRKHPKEPHGRHVELHHPEEIALFKDVAPTLGDASEILLMGPGEAKVQFQKFLKEHHAGTALKISGVETVDHPSDAQILAFAEKFFNKLI